MTRPFSRHLDDVELEALVRLLPTCVSELDLPLETGLADLHRHIEYCEDCDRKVQLHKDVQTELLRLSSSGSVPDDEGCPKDIDWLHLAAGLLRDAEAKELMSHAAQCNHCGPLLRDATEVLSDEPTPEEKLMLARKGGALRVWKRTHARKLIRNVQSTPHTERFGRWKWWAWTSTAAVAALIVASILPSINSAFQRYRLARVNSLLASSYADNRTVEMRMEQTEYAPTKQLRTAGNGQSQMSRPTSLMEAEAIIARELKSHANDATWLDAKGRADLLDGNYGAALVALEKAHELSPERTIVVDLASAYFVRAELQDRPIDYGRAADLLGSVLASSPSYTVALFNRAIALERIFLYKQAEADWVRYLQLDSTSAWADEARSRLSTLRGKLRESHDRSSSPLASPQEFAKDVAEENPNAIANLDARVDSYLDGALRKWLPAAFPNPTARGNHSEDAGKGLDALASVLASRHGDSWLRDLLHNSRLDPGFPAVTTLLTQSYIASARGDFARARQLSAHAVLQYRMTGNKAGSLRARWEHLYATRLSLSQQECLHEAKALWTEVKHTSYYWMQARVLIDYSQCAYQHDLIQLAMDLNARALRLSKQHSFPDLELRTAKFAADFEWGTSEPAVPFRHAVQALQRYWNGSAGYMSAYNLYTCLDVGAEFNQLWYLDASVIREALSVASTDPDHGMLGVEERRLADALLISGDLAGAEIHLALARQLFGSMPDGESIRNRLADVEIGFAQVELFRRNAWQAIGRLERIHSQVNRSSVSSLSFEFFDVLGRALSSVGELGRSRDALLSAITIAEVGLRRLRTERDRLTWSHRNAGVYRELIHVLQQQDTPAAFKCLEWFKSASLRTLPAVETAPPLIGDVRQSFCSFDQQMARALVHKGSALISYISFPEGTSVWVSDQSGLSYRWLSISSRDLEPLARDFAIHCSTPGSDIATLRRESQRLYRILFEPIESLVKERVSLILEADGVLELVPFGALLDTSGHYVGDRFRMSVSPGLKYLAASRTVLPFTRASKVLIVANDTSILSSDIYAEAHVVASGFSRPILLMGNNATLAAISRELESAEIFHFAGHAVVDASIAGLVIREHADRDEREYMTAIDLSQKSLRQARLVVLSACATAIGSSGGFTDSESMARALVASGIPQVIASRWNVDSQTTRKLMTMFYARLLAGRPAEDAIEDAKRALRADPLMDHPFYWAAFEMFGKANAI